MESVLVFLVLLGLVAMVLAGFGVFMMLADLVTDFAISEYLGRLLRRRFGERR